MKHIFMAAFAVSLLIASSPVQARPHAKHGSCDGIHRCRWGSTQASYFGFPRVYNGHNLWQANEWPRAFPRTTPHAGVVGYQRGGGPTGHVFRLVSEPVGCTAMVADDAGQYERDICRRGAIFVNPNHT
jgi:hypothetical protein